MRDPPDVENQDERALAQRAFELYVTAASQGTPVAARTLGDLLTDEADRTRFHRLVAFYERYRRSLSEVGGPPIAASGSVGVARSIGEFDLLEEIGRGGMGVVYRARQHRLDREVAVKLLSDAQSMLPGAARRFEREIQAIARVSHPNIIPIFASGTQGDVLYYAMPLLAGPTLQAKIDAHRGGGARGMPPGDAAKIALALAEALAAAHAAGIVHRDVKPSNVVFDAGGSPVLVDFGIARDVRATDATLTNQPMGTIQFAAPERLFGDAVEEVGIDVYSLGATLYAMLTLEPPRTGASLAAIIESARRADAAPPRRANPEIAVDLETICLKALERDPPRRYASAAAMAADLDAFLHFRPIAARPATPWIRTSRFVRRHRVPLGTALLAVAATLAAVLGLMPPPTPEGYVQFGSLEDGVTIEYAAAGDAASPAWQRVDDWSEGRAQLPPGRYSFRAVKRNCFPRETKATVAVEDGDSTAVELAQPLPIVRWSRSLDAGAMQRPPVVVSSTVGGKEIILNSSSVFGRFQAHSGHTHGTSNVGVHEKGGWWAIPGPYGECSARMLVTNGDEGLLQASDLLETAWPAPSEAKLDGVTQVEFADVDGDGLADLVVGRRDGVACVVDPRTGVVHSASSPAARCAALSVAHDGAGQALVVVLRQDSSLDVFRVRRGDLERVSSTRVDRSLLRCIALHRAGHGDRVALYGSSGAWLFDPTRGEGPCLLAPGRATYAVAADLDGDDGSDELVVAYPGSIHAFRQDGVSLWTRGDAEPGFTFLAAGDLDGEPGDEVVVAAADGTVRSIRRDGTYDSWVFESDGRSPPRHPPVVDDVDGDGRDDIVIQTGDQKLWVLAGSPSHRKWIAHTPWQVGSRPALVHVDGDEPVIVVGAAGAGPYPRNAGMGGPSIVALDPRTGASRWSTPAVAEMEFMWSPDIADVDADGEADTVAIDRTDRLVAYRARDGRRVLDQSLPPDSFSVVPPRIVDADRDGFPEILHRAGTAGAPALQAWCCRTSAPLWRIESDWCEVVVCIELGDVGSDGRIEAACGRSDGFLTLLAGTTGETIRTLSIGGRDKCPIRIADVTGDGAADLIVGVCQGEVGLVAFDGRTLERAWGYGTQSAVESQPAVADLDGDGAPDVIHADWDYRVHACRGTDGRAIWEPRFLPNGAFFSSPVVGDLECDGDLEIVIGSTDRKVFVLDGRTGSLERSYGTRAPVWGTALLADVDGDGALEIVIGDEDGLVHAIPGRDGSR